MFNRLIRRADRDRHVGPALRMYLWWGLLIRGALLIALSTLLVVEGNFLAEWLLSWRMVPSMHANLEEYTAITYVVFGVFLAVGIYLRWLVIQRMAAVPSRAEERASTSTDAPDAGE